MSAEAESIVAVVEEEDARESGTGQLLLCAIDAFESKKEHGPTVPELAAYLGIKPDFGHSHLVAHLQQELLLGRVSHYGNRVKLTRAGRSFVVSEVLTPRRLAATKWSTDPMVHRPDVGDPGAQ